MTEAYDLVDLFYSRSLVAMGEPGEVLVVDDNPESLMIAQRALLGLGPKVVTVDTVEKAKEYLRWNVPRAIVTDLIFPAASGFSLLDSLKKSKRLKAVPILVMSGWKNGTLIEKAQRLGASEYLVKPFSPLVLRSKVAARI